MCPKQPEERTKEENPGYAEAHVTVAGLGNPPYDNSQAQHGTERISLLWRFSQSIV